VRIKQSALDAIRAHGAEGYPHEICGIMLGPRGEGGVTEVRRARYEIDPRDHIRIQREADAEGLDIVGYYHSHPDHPAQASRFDTERAWAGYIYLIVAIANGQPVDENGFVADNDGGPFRPEPLVVD
jgi:proteasome lid subunit RPN8/RPN11